MEFGLNEAQTILKKETRKFLQNECSLDYVKEMTEDEKGYSPILWRKMAELGWMGVLFEEKYGGSEGTFIDLSILLEEMGKVLLPGPFFSTVIFGGGTIMNSGDNEMKQRFLPGIASGDIIMTLALVEKGGNYALEEIESKGELKLDSYLIQGQKMFVSYANIADHIIFPVRTYEKGHSNGISLFIVDTKSKGIDMIPLISLNLQRLFEVSFMEVDVPKSSLLGEDGKGWTLIQNLWPMAVTGKCCEMLGAMQGVFEIAVDYAQKRRQFDRPLSAFQVIQHQCADMAIEMECSRLITYQAVWRVSNGLPSRKEVAMAKAWSSDALKKITTMAHQIHGGIGFTKDQNLFLYFRYAKAEETAFGDANFHNEIVASEMDS
jgi:alkylation response protein AidB-like acyl-CoA dehydrogenase